MGKKILLLLCVAVLCVGVCGILPIHGEEKIYGSVVRLHVLAHSDDEEDQALKLRVRDDILAYTATLVTGEEGRDEMLSRLTEHLEDIREVAAARVKKDGYDYDVAVTLTTENYPTREYEGLRFPAGEYVSLRVSLGDAAGHNWWCVLFPPLCLSAATAKSKSENEQAFIAAGLSKEQYKIITETDAPKYALRFKFLETVEEWFGN